VGEHSAESTATEETDLRARPRVRPASVADLPAVVALARRAAHGQRDESSFRASVGSATVRLDLLVLEEEGRERILGYLEHQLVLDELEIHDLAVDPDARGQGRARQLLGEVLAWAHRAGAGRAFLEVREGNAPARALYTHFGFWLIGRRRGYYQDPVEDALILGLEL